MICRVTNFVFLAVLSGATTLRAQTDTVHYPAPGTVVQRPAQPPWTVPGGICSRPAAAQQREPPTSLKGVQITSPLAHLDQVTAIADIPELNYVLTANILRTNKVKRTAAAAPFSCNS
jgi:hypothetical protein